ncbi:hypothetical protein EPO34_02510 [Patescibacteria group bacterium]|nr:MAG: hypothetical protein EPO34_02510 [Patescibacteria group bacterium]
MGASAAGIGLASFGSSIHRPIDEQLARSAVGYLTPSQQEAKSIELSKSRDTDQDGLSDYDEQNVYRTSAYLKDSDSDGIDDKTEVLAGNDPNCPLGKECGRGSGYEAFARPATIAVPEPPQAPILASAPTSFRSTEELEAYFKSISPEELRAALIQAGLPKEAVDSMDDQALRDLFDKTVKDAVAAGQFTDVLPPSAP